jgi:hypothetical protein
MERPIPAEELGRQVGDIALSAAHSVLSIEAFSAPGAPAAMTVQREWLIASLCLISRALANGLDSNLAEKALDSMYESVFKNLPTVGIPVDAVPEFWRLYQIRVVDYANVIRRFRERPQHEFAMAVMANIYGGIDPLHLPQGLDLMSLIAAERLLAILVNVVEGGLTNVRS